MEDLTLLTTLLDNAQRELYRLKALQQKEAAPKKGKKAQYEAESKKRCERLRINMLKKKSQ
jgi:hypothetical protein